MLANTAVELGPHDAEVAAKISRYVRHTEAVFERAVIRAQEAGEIPADRDPRALARFLVNALHGLRVLARLGLVWNVREVPLAVRREGSLA